MSADRKSDFGLAFGIAEEAEARIGPPPDAGPGADGGELDSGALRALSEEISSDFAPQLEHTALVLYDRDPEHLQAQWYVTPEELAQARSLFHDQGAGLRQVLRLRRLDQDGKPEVVASVSPQWGKSKGEGQESFALQADGAEYECELGLESDTGGWLLLARSNRIALPVRNLPPPQTPPTAGDSQMRESSQGTIEDPYLLEEIPVEAALAAVGEPLYPVFPNLELDALDDSGASPPPLPSKELFGKVYARGQSPEPPVGTVQLQPEPDAQTGSSAHPIEGLESMPPPLLPSTPDRDGPPEMIGALYDPRAALSSAVARRAQSAQLALEIRAELIVEGRVSPGSTVELFGHAVPVGDDGRFYIRRPVEDPLLLSLAVVHPPIPDRKGLRSE